MSNPRKCYELLADRFEHKAGTVVYQCKHHDYMGLPMTMNELPANFTNL